MSAQQKGVGVLAVLDRIQRAADTAPFTPVGHVIEHNIGADRFREIRAIVAEQIEAGHRADGDERPARPERGPGYSDEEWAIFLRGWDAHAEAVYRSGLRAALARARDGAE